MSHDSAANQRNRDGEQPPERLYELHRLTNDQSRPKFQEFMEWAKVPPHETRFIRPR